VLEFAEHAPQLIALDGQPVEPHCPEGDRVLLALAQRVDLILDATGSPGTRFTVTDTFYRGWEYRLLDLAYNHEPPLRPAPTRCTDSTSGQPTSGSRSADRNPSGGGLRRGMMGGTVVAEQVTCAGCWAEASRGRSTASL
jgi:FtsP/CotA-like multicopper oxidase with cupredoxin domain